jgi:hypothetical protein
MVHILSSGAQSVAAGFNHSLIVKTDGSLWAMGDNYYGQLGDGTTTQRNTPVQILTSGVKAVSAGGYYSLIVKTDGSLWAMGDNYYGQLGDGTTTQRNTPVQILSGGVQSVSAGGYHSLILKTDGSLWAIGDNYYGQLGDGTTTQRNAPVQILSGGVQSVAAGDWHSLILKTDGSLWAMGANYYGQLGDGTTTQCGTPKLVARNVQKIAAGWSHSLIVASGDISVSMPFFTTQPVGKTIAVGASTAFTVAALSSSTYQWQILTSPTGTWSNLSNGAVYTGTTTATLTISSATAEMSGYQYRCVATNSIGSTNSTAAMLTIGTASRLSALAVRTESGPGADVLIVGVVVSGASGDEKKQVIVRGVGPGLQQSGVANFLSDPEARVYSGSTVIASNDNWDSTTMKSALAAVGLDTLASGSKDAAMLAQLGDGGYTVQVGAKTNENGVALAEIYESDSTTTSHMSAMAVRAKAGTNEKTLIAGFIIQGAANKRLVIRGLGPALAGALGSGYLADPKLDVYSGSTVIASNDNWGNTQELRTAFASVGLQPMEADSKDAALIADLPPGGYTVWLTGVNATTGIGLIEIYELP